MTMAISRSSLTGTCLAACVLSMTHSMSAHAVQARDYIPLPDGPARYRLLEMYIVKDRPVAGDVDLGRLCDLLDGYSGADCVALLTEWNEFRTFDLKRVKALMRRPVMVDLRNVHNPVDMAAAGFIYSSVGRPSFPPAADA